MLVNQLFIGSIIEDTKTGTVYEITGVSTEYRGFNEIYRYTVRPLINPLGVRTTNIEIANVYQLSSIYFYNVYAKCDPDSGLAYFPLTTIDVIDSEKLIENEKFLPNYFYKVRLFEKNNIIYRARLKCNQRKTIKLVRLANKLERFIYARPTVVKNIHALELFEEYLVHSK